MNRRQFLICLCAVLLWIAFIFCRSLQPVDASLLESERVLALLQRLLRFELSLHAVRKLAHFTEFLVLGALAGLLFGGRCGHLSTGLVFAVMVGVITALCDETLQLFVGGRTGQLSDVWIDMARASAGAMIALLIRFLWKRGKKQGSEV